MKLHSWEQAACQLREQLSNVTRVNRVFPLICEQFGAGYN